MVVLPPGRLPVLTCGPCCPVRRAGRQARRRLRGRGGL